MKERDIYEDAARLMHMAFCGELVRVVKSHPEESPRDIPEAVKVLNAIEVLENLYPSLK